MTKRAENSHMFVLFIPFELMISFPFYFSLVHVSPLYLKFMAYFSLKLLLCVCVYVCVSKHINTTCSICITLPVCTCFQGYLLLYFHFDKNPGSFFRIIVSPSPQCVKFYPVEIFCSSPQTFPFTKLLSLEDLGH